LEHFIQTRSDCQSQRLAGRIKRLRRSIFVWCDVVLASAAVDLDAWNSKWNAMEADIASVEHIGVSKAEGRPMRHCLKTSSLYRAGSSATADYKWLSMQSELQAIDRRSAGDGPLNRDMMHLVTAR